MSQSHFLPRNVQPLEQTSNAVGEVQLLQSHSEEAGIEKDYQQSPQGIRAQNPVDRVPPVYNESVTSALLAQQLPLLPKFSGEVSDGDMDTFQDWLEQFEMIAGVCGWSPQARLVNLVARLQGQAYLFLFMYNSTED